MSNAADLETSPVHADGKAHLRLDGWAGPVPYISKAPCMKLSKNAYGSSPVFGATLCGGDLTHDPTVGLAAVAPCVPCTRWLPVLLLASVWVNCAAAAGRTPVRVNWHRYTDDPASLRLIAPRRALSATAQVGSLNVTLEALLGWGTEAIMRMAEPSR